MGIKGELGGGFPETKPAFIITVDWDAAYNLGPTTHPKNNLSYVKGNGTVRPVQDSDFPPLAADFVDYGVWMQQEVLPSGEVWCKTEASALLRVVDPPNTSADPAVAETETGLIRLQWSGLAGYSEPEGLNHVLEKDNSELKRVRGEKKRVMVCKFETGDPRYKYLEHAVYVGNGRIVPVAGQEGVVFEIKVSYLAA